MHLYEIGHIMQITVLCNSTPCIMYCTCEHRRHRNLLQPNVIQSVTELQHTSKLHGIKRVALHFE